MVSRNRATVRGKICRGLLGVAVVLGTGCAPSLSPQELADYRARSLYTCCNIHYEHSELTDANYHVGQLLPLGTPVKVVAAARGGVTFSADSNTFTLYHSYGTEQESFRQYIDKVLTTKDPKVVLEQYPASVQQAIRDSRVERSMTKAQVILSVGYPATHRTPSLDQREWTYWHNRWVTYQVVFDDAGIVSDVVGASAPTRGIPVR